MSDVQRFVKVEYVGGPWDGKTEVREYPLQMDRVHVPLLGPVPSIKPEVVEMGPTFRVGEYHRDWTGRVEEMFDVVALTSLQMKSAVVGSQELQAYAVERKRPIIFNWEGE